MRTGALRAVMVARKVKDAHTELVAYNLPATHQSCHAHDARSSSTLLPRRPAGCLGGHAGGMSGLDPIRELASWSG